MLIRLAGSGKAYTARGSPWHESALHFGLTLVSCYAIACRTGRTSYAGNKGFCEVARGCNTTSPDFYSFSAKSRIENWH